MKIGNLEDTARPLGGTDGELQTALSYSNVVFAGNVLLWLMNGLASVIRGTGNMMVPAMVISAGVVVLVPLSPFRSSELVLSQRLA